MGIVTLIGVSKGIVKTHDGVVIVHLRLREGQVWSSEVHLVGRLLGRVTSV
jgi:hypothetical protein